MANNPLRFHPQAEQEYLTSLAWYRERSLIAAINFENAFEEAVGRIREAPRRWPKILEVDWGIARRLALRAADSFWQARYYDFNVWGERKFVEKLRYIHRNPVKRGLIERPEDWSWSSFLLSHFLQNRREVGHPVSTPRSLTGATPYLSRSGTSRHSSTADHRRG